MADFQVLGSPGKISVSVVPSGTKNPVAERCKTRRQLHLWLPQPDPRNLRSLQLHCASTQRCENLSTSSRAHLVDSGSHGADLCSVGVDVRLGDKGA